MTFRIETERLLMRPLEPKDADAHIAMMEDPAIAAYLTPDGKPQDRGTNWRSYATLLGHWQIRGFGFFAVEEKETGEFVGRVGPWMPEGWPALECGWSIARSKWGRGYAPEAAIAAINWTFDRFPDLSRIISVIDPGNQNSQAVAKKVGETNSGEQFEYWGFTLDIWSADRDEWLAKFGDLKGTSR